MQEKHEAAGSQARAVQRVLRWLEHNQHRVDQFRFLSDWQQMQDRYNPWRKAQVDIIVRTIRSLPFSELTILDLCCGPGTLSHALLGQDDRVRVIGLDANPLFLSVYRDVMAGYGDRATVIRGDIRRATVLNALPHVQGVMSLTSLHWLAKNCQQSLYQTLQTKIADGGVFVNGDRYTHQSALLHSITLKEVPECSGSKWREFWAGFKSEYGLTDEVDQLDQDLWEGTDEGYTLQFYLSALLAAGFKLADVLFARGDRIVYCGTR